MLVVARYNVRCVAGGGVVVESDPRSLYLDLLFLCSSVFQDVLQSSWTFGGIEFGTYLTIKDAALQSLADAPIAMTMALQDHVSEAGEVLALPPPDALANSRPLYLQVVDNLLQQQAVCESDAFVEVNN